MVRTIIMTRICCVRVWFMGRHIYSYSLGNFPRINISYLVSNMITSSVNSIRPGRLTEVMDMVYPISVRLLIDVTRLMSSQF